MVDIRRDNVNVPATLPTELMGLVAFKEVSPGVFEPVLLKQTGSALHSKPTMIGEVFASGTLINGANVDVPMAGAPIPCTLAINPVVGDTVSYWYTVDGTNYVLRAAVTAYAEDVIDAPIIGLRFARTAGAGITSTWAVA